MRDPVLQEVLDELRRNAGVGYLREDLVEQRRALNEFLGEPQASFYALQNSYGGDAERRWEAACRMRNCADRIRPLLPESIQQSLMFLTNLAGTWTKDRGLKLFNTVEVMQDMQYNWSLLQGYARVLHEVVVQMQMSSTTKAAELGSTMEKSPTPAYAKDDIVVDMEGSSGPSTTKVKKAIEEFPTPAGATWEQVSIRFRDGHTVSIKVRDVIRVCNYTQMGMFDLRNGNPTQQWKLLELFAEGEGTLDWSLSGATRRNQKRREVLARDLQAFFGIDGAPFVLTPDRKGWQARFIISSHA